MVDWIEFNINQIEKGDLFRFIDAFRYFFPTSFKFNFITITPNTICMALDDYERDVEIPILIQEKIYHIKFHYLNVKILRGLV